MTNGLGDKGSDSDIQCDFDSLAAGNSAARRGESGGGDNGGNNKQRCIGSECSVLLRRNMPISHEPLL